VVIFHGCGPPPPPYEQIGKADEDDATNAADNAADNDPV
jgi:hypothetical protein